jgi:protein gp37
VSRIQWTDQTWNPVTGCTKVSAGCKNCYAEALFPRVCAGQFVRCKPFQTKLSAGARITTRKRCFTDVLCHPGRLNKPLKRRKPTRWFVNSMSDLFHEDVPDSFIDQVFAVMALCPQHTFQVLTKRERRMRTWVTEDGGAVVEAFHENEKHWEIQWPGWPLPNVWLGVSVENQPTADDRIRHLLDTPAAVRFVSAEPLLGPVDFGAHLWRTPFGKLDWVIVGGESGPKARPCDVAWIRSIVEQCKTTGVACFVKQLGRRPLWEECDAFGDRVDLETLPRRLWRQPCLDRKGGDPADWPEDLRVREWPETNEVPA